MALGFDSLGREIPDPTPLELSPGQARPETIQEMMQRLIRTHLSQAAQDAGEESFEEANDFDIEDEDFDDVLTTYEEMGQEYATAGESEDGAAPGRNPGQAEPSGLRTVGTGAPAGSGNPETDNVDGGPGVDADPSVPAAARAEDPGALPGTAAVLGRRKRSAG